MPKPHKGESRNSYVSRAISYLIHKEGLGHNAAVGKAEGMYTYYIAKKKRKKGKK